LKTVAEKEFVLTEWDFDMPRNNRFHDPIQPQENNVECVEHSEQGASRSASSTPK
jgi:hypothetical protein